MYTYMHPLSSRIVEPCLFRLYALSTFSLTSLGRLYHIPPFLYAHALSSILKLTFTKNKINIINSLKKKLIFYDKKLYLLALFSPPLFEVDGYVH